MKIELPNIFYHGSKKIFETFDETKCYASKRRSVFGAFWFSTDEKVAKSYGKILYCTRLKIRNPYIVDAQGENYSEIYLGELPEEMCLVIDQIDNRKEGATYDHLKYGRSQDPEFSLRFDSCELALAAKKAGFDSIIIQNVRDAGNKSALKIMSNTIAVFNNNQIKIKEVIK